MNRRRKRAIAFGLILLIFACLYFVGLVYFTDHFFYGTRINGVDFSLKTVEDVERYLSEQTEDYEITVIPREGKDEVIRGKDISLEYVSDGSVKSMLDRQDRFKWPSMFEKSDELSCERKVDFDTKKARESVYALECIKEEGKYDSKDAVPEFDGESFKAKPEVYGTLADKNIAAEAICGAMSRLEDKIKLEDTGCYTDPKRLKDDPKLIEACESLNKYCKASITYDMISHEVVIDKELISQWLSWDDDLNITFHDEKVSEYMKEFGSKYDTVGTTRYFTTPDGRSAEVTGGPFGWEIDEAAEEEALLASIKAGETVTKQPAYVRYAVTHGDQDWGSTYVEVDLSYQHMWCVIDGSVAMESDVVTGRPGGHETPPGVHTILAMQRNAVLVGNILPSTGKPEYRTKVSYWMQVTYDGVGLHDATWQPTFGGTRYIYGGSHGCINMPYQAAASLFDMVYVGMPVVIHD